MAKLIETAVGTVSVGIRVKNSMKLRSILRRMKTSATPIENLRVGDIIVTNRYVGNIRSAFAVDRIHTAPNGKLGALYSVIVYEMTFSKKPINPFTSTRYTFSTGDIVEVLHKK